MTNVSPSALIFVVVIAIWATYASLYVVRRREQLSTARSVDRFSAHMRVLQRRSVKTVPRAVPSSSGGARTSILSAGVSATAARVDEPVVPAPDTLSARLPSRLPTVRRPRLRVPAAAKVGIRRVAQPARVGEALAALPIRRLRAYAFLALTWATLITTVLAVVHTVSPVLPVVTLLGSGSLFAWVRADRNAELAAARRREASEAIEAERLDALARREQAQARPTVASMPVAQEHVAPRERRPFDLAEFLGEPEASGRRVQRDPLLDERDWEPVPVPPPTYTMKAKAERQAPMPLQVPSDVPVPIAAEDDIDDAFWGESAVTA